MQRAKLRKDGNLHTVEVDGVVVGQDLDLTYCESLMNELNKSNDECDIILKMFKK